MKFGYTILLLTVSSILLLGNPVYAQEIDLETLDLEKLVKTYNENLEKVPNFVKSIFGNERIDIYVDGEKILGVVGQNGTIIEYKKGGVEKPTMKMYTTSETIDDLLEGKKTLLDAVKDKSINYEGIGIFKKIKFGFIKIFQGIFLRR